MDFNIVQKILRLYSKKRDDNQHNSQQNKKKRSGQVRRKLQNLSDDDKNRNMETKTFTNYLRNHVHKRKSNKYSRKMEGTGRIIECKNKKKLNQKTLKE